MRWKSAKPARCRPSRRCSPIAAHTVAALIIEPLLQGAGGMRLCRPSFLKRLVKMARDAGVLVIFDEVATGFGRTGTLFAMEQADVVPDLVCLSKGLTAGYMPMAVTVAREPIFEAFLGESFERALPHGHSFTANPLACAVALASLALFEEEKTLERIARINRRHREFMAELAVRPDVTRLRLIGSILAFDVKAGGGYQSWESRALRNWFLAHGLNIRPLGQTIYLMPPYCITDEELARAYAGIVEVPRHAGLGRVEQPIDDVPGDAAADAHRWRGWRGAARPAKAACSPLLASGRRPPSCGAGRRARRHRAPGAPPRRPPEAAGSRQARLAALRAPARRATRRSCQARAWRKAGRRQERAAVASARGSRQGPRANAASCWRR